MDSSEAMKRMKVELEMTQREVEVLRTAAQHATPYIPPRESPSLATEQLLEALRIHCQQVEEDNEILRSRLRQTKALILERESIMTEEGNRLRQRISENRKHMNLVRSFNVNPDGLQPSALSTPFIGRLQNAPDIHPSQRPSSKARGDEAFAALLLADRVLRQDRIRSPPTPVYRTPKKPQLAQKRSSHTMSNMPSTPIQSRNAPSTANMPLQHVPRGHQLQLPPTPSYRRRESRDSTISASDAEVDHRTTQNYPRTIIETPRSQGRFILPSKSIMRTPQTPKSQQINTPKFSSGLIQTKIHGRVTKPTFSRAEEQSKRKARESDDAPGSLQSKKGRMEEGVGLGIGGLTSPGR